jgi:hypothetical protein
VTVLQIQCFSFSLIGEATRGSIVERLGGGNELVSPWERSTTRHCGVATSARGDAAPGRGKGGDNASWADANLTGLKMNKTHTVDSATTNVQ